MDHPLISPELLEHLRSQLGGLQDGATAVVTRAGCKHDEMMLAAAASHRRQLALHISLVEALLDALTEDPIGRATRVPVIQRFR